MGRYKKGGQCPTDLAGSMIEDSMAQGQSVAVVIHDPKDFRIKPNEPFVILFYRSLLSVIVDKKLTTTDLKVILTVLDFVSQGNVVSLTHQDVAMKAKLVRQQVTNSLGKLVNAGVLVKSDSGSLFLNPHLIAKENLKEIKGTEAYKVGGKKTKQLAF